MKKSLSRGRECVLLCAIQLLLCAAVYRFNIPNPNIILFVFLSAVLVQCGYLVGTLCGILTLLYSMFFFSIDHSWIYFEPINRDKLIVVLLGLIANIIYSREIKMRYRRFPSWRQKGSLRQYARRFCIICRMIFARPSMGFWEWHTSSKATLRILQRYWKM